MIQSYHNKVKTHKKVHQSHKVQSLSSMKESLKKVDKLKAKLEIQSKKMVEKINNRIITNQEDSAKEQIMLHQ